MDEPSTVCAPASQISEALVAHSCVHANHGPFITAVAPLSLPGLDVSSIHHAYELQLPDDEPGFISYRPARDGQHILLTDVDVMILPSGSSDPLSSITVEGCETLTQGVVVNLEVGIEQGFLLDGGGSVLLFIEHAPSFGEDVPDSCTS